MGVHNFSIELPASWYPFVLDEVNRTNDYSTITAGFALEPEVGRRLLFGLENAWAFASANIRENSHRWAMIRNPEAGRVDAVVSLDFMSEVPGDEERYLELARQETAVEDTLEVINRTVSQREMKSGTAVLIHDFVLPHSADDDSHPATERAVVALFPPGASLLAEFAIVTQDLGLFDDIQESLATVVESFSLSTAAKVAL